MIAHPLTGNTPLFGFIKLIIWVTSGFCVWAQIKEICISAIRLSTFQTQNFKATISVKSLPQTKPQNLNTEVSILNININTRAGLLTTMIHLNRKRKYATNKDSVISFDSLREVYHIQSFLHWQMMAGPTPYGLGVIYKYWLDSSATGPQQWAAKF